MQAKSLFDLTDEKAIVTGAAQGLGKHMVLALAEAGADVAIVDLNLAGAKEVAEMVEKIGRRSIALKVDVSQEASVGEMVKTVKDQFGRIDILINNAGIVNNSPAEEMTTECWEQVVKIDLTGVFLCAQAVGREMIKQKKGSIINISSMSGLIVNRPQPQIHYNTSKAGVVMITKCLAAEWAKYNIRVNAIAPGYMGTVMVKRVFDQYRDHWLPLIPMGRIGEPREIRGPAVFLASKASSYMTGAVVVMDGGYTVW